MKSTSNAAGTDAAEALGALPRWDLSDLYPAPDSPGLQRDLSQAAADAEAFEAAYKGRLAGLDGAGLGAAVAEYERVDEAASRIASYASLVFSGDMTDPEIGKFYQTMQERVTDVTAHLLFFSLEINRLEDAEMARRLKAPALARYAPWVRDSRVFRPHQLSDELERLLHETHVVGRAAWLRQHPGNRGDDALIAGAAAQVAAELDPDATRVGRGQADHDVARGDQHARRAVAALQAVLGGEGAAQARHDRVVVEALDGAHLGAVAGKRVGDAGARDLAVDLHRAGAADAVLAAQVRAGQQQMLAQEVGQVGARLDRGGHGLAVDGEADGLAGHDACPMARSSATAWI